MIIGSLSLLVIQRWQEGTLSVSFNMFAAAVYSQYIVSSNSVLLCNQDTTAGIATSYRLDGRGFESRQEQDIFNFSKTVQKRSRAHPAPFPMDSGVLSQLQSSRGMKLTTHLYLVQKLRMNGAIPLLLLYALMV
jgi:hypothetical protein